MLFSEEVLCFSEPPSPARGWPVRTAAGQRRLMFGPQARLIPLPYVQMKPDRVVVLMTVVGDFPDGQSSGMHHVPLFMSRLVPACHERQNSLVAAFSASVLGAYRDWLQVHLAVPVSLLHTFDLDGGEPLDSGGSVGRASFNEAVGAGVCHCAAVEVADLN